MGRPRGSKNKVSANPAVEAEIEAVGQVIEEGVTPLPSEVVKEPTSPSGLCKGCGHDGSMHYGTKDNWCNTMRCTCQAFK